MAFRFTLTYANLKASLSYSDLKVSDITRQKAAASTAFVDTRSTVHNELLKSLVAYTELSTVVQYIQLTAVDIILDAESKNLYFTPQHGSANAVTIGFTEALAFSVGKGLVDTPTLSDSPALSVSRPLADSLTFGEVFAKSLHFYRTYSDSFSFSDVISSGVDLGKTETTSLSDALSYSGSFAHTETLSFTEDFAKQFDTGVTDTSSITDTLSYSGSFAYTDTPTITEAIALGLSKPLPLDSTSVSDSSVLAPNLGKSETLSIADSFSRVVPFSRTFTDTVSLDDRASISDPLQTDVSSIKTNVVGFTDAHSYTFSKPFSDTYGFTEQIEVSPTRIVSDSFAFTDAIVNTLDLGKTESVPLSESLSMSFSTFATDSATISEAISIVTVQSHSVLNATPLNTGTLN